MEGSTEGNRRLMLDIMFGQRVGRLTTDFGFSSNVWLSVR